MYADIFMYGVCAIPLAPNANQDNMYVSDLYTNRCHPLYPVLEKASSSTAFLPMFFCNFVLTRGMYGLPRSLRLKKGIWPEGGGFLTASRANQGSPVKKV